MKEGELEIEKKIELENKLKARAWVRKNMESLITALNKSRESILEVFKKNPDLLDYLNSPGEDAFSSPICGPLMKHFPDSLLGEANKILSGAGKQGREINHAFFMLGNYIIDPTFGQFIPELDKSISEHPELFEGRILVATSKEIQTIFNLNYQIPTKQNESK